MARDPRGFVADPTTRAIDEEARRARREHGGITKLQARQIAWLRRWSRTESRERLRGYFIECNDCRRKTCQHTAVAAVEMLLRHAGHDTWIRMLPGTPVDDQWWRRT